jgi:NADP-dependent aldehyde dehydrogenase
MELHGRNLIGGAEAAETGRFFRAFAPQEGNELEPAFDEATSETIDRALASAEAAFVAFRAASPTARAGFLDRIAEEILALGDELIDRARRETALAVDRLTGERMRTVNQLRLFAEVVREGSWVEARLDRAQPARQPAPRPDLRRMLIPIGPVAVFAASNFPFAFSVAGGDTASALAAGCPVVVKAHPAHPGTSEMVARAIARAASETGMPAGVFGLLHGRSHDVGLNLVRDPRMRAVGFTGSLSGGRALFDAAAAREAPIPVYAEMGSVNPVFVLPGAAASRADALAEGLKGSVTLGVGQFCTNPGLIVGLGDEHLRALTDRLSGLMAAAPPGMMLYPGLRDAYVAGLAALGAIEGVRVVNSASAPDAAKNEAVATLFATDARTFLRDERLGEELFGPSTVVVECAAMAELEAVARRLGGHLTATIHGTAEELAEYAWLVALLEDRVGRLIFNGYPTGVEVSPAMHHGGPYPATTDARATSVGTAAIQRFARPVCYQNFPSAALPVELQDANRRGIWRLVDGELTKEDLAPRSI